MPQGMARIVFKVFRGSGAVELANFIGGGNVLVGWINGFEALYLIAADERG